MKYILILIYLYSGASSMVAVPTVYDSVGACLGTGAYYRLHANEAKKRGDIMYSCVEAS